MLLKLFLLKRKVSKLCLMFFIFVVSIASFILRCYFVLNKALENSVLNEISLQVFLEKTYFLKNIVKENIFGEFYLFI